MMFAIYATPVIASSATVGYIVAGVAVNTYGKLMKLRTIRKNRTPPVSVRAVARELGCEPSTISRIERGTLRPKPALARKVAEWYGVELVTVLAPETGDGAAA